MVIAVNEPLDDCYPNLVLGAALEVSDEAGQLEILAGCRLT